MAQIELRNLAKSFPGGVSALFPTDLAIEPGELVVVLGPSGSGKSTLLRLIAGLESPSAGGVFVEGDEITHLPPHRRDLAMVFQQPALYPHLTVADNLAFGLRAQGVGRAQTRSKVNTIAGILGLDHVLTRRPGALSGGERQRVAIGRALARQPRLLLFDEPFSSLDLPLRAALREEVIRIQRRLGITLVHVTHDQGEALLMGDRVVVLDRGRLLQHGTPRTIYDRPVHRFVATFVGSPAMNILPCQIEREDETGTIRVQPFATDRSSGWTTDPATLPAGWEGTSRLFDLGLRPEAISLRDHGATSVARPNMPVMGAKVRRVEFNGPELIATLSLGPHELIARLPANQAVEDRQDVEIVLDLGRAVWFDQSTGGALSRA